jgi:hypothetical protein
VELAFDLPSAAETLLGFTAIALVVLVVIRMMRSSQPDPKMTLLLSLMSDFPKDPAAGALRAEIPRVVCPARILGRLAQAVSASLPLADTSLVALTR